MVDEAFSWEQDEKLHKYIDTSHGFYPLQLLMEPEVILWFFPYSSKISEDNTVTDTLLS